MRRTTKSLFAAALAGTVFLAACGSSDDNAADSTTTTPAGGTDAGSTESGAATLRAGLTSLLQEHVYLAGVTVETAVDAMGDVEDPAVVAASSALDENSQALADAVASVAGQEKGDAFLDLWRNHIGFFVDYTLGKATADDAMVDQALSDLDGYQEAAGAFFEEITAGNITSDAVVANLETHIETLTAAIDALVAGDASAFDLLQQAADHMQTTAAALSGAIVAAVPAMFDGSVDSTASQTRATLTYLLQEHAYLAGIAVDQAVEASGDLTDPAAAAAVQTLDDNSVALSEVVASVAGQEKGDAFLDLWRNHIGFFVDYTLGKATADDAMVDQALSDLDGYQEAAGAFFEEITAGNLTSDAVVASLETHIETLTAAIDAVVAGDASAFTKLRAAGQHMPMTAAALSAAVVAATS